MCDCFFCMCFRTLPCHQPYLSHTLFPTSRMDFSALLYSQFVLVMILLSKVHFNLYNLQHNFPKNHVLLPLDNPQTQLHVFHKEVFPFKCRKYLRISTERSVNYPKQQDVFLEGHVTVKVFRCDCSMLQGFMNNNPKYNE